MLAQSGVSSRVLGRTATGPIYRSQKTIAMIPTRSAWLLLQELASRIEDPDAEVVSSLAGRLSGDDAHQAWMNISTEIVVPLVVMPGVERIRFLRRVIALIRQSGRVDGLEPVLGAAVNGVWPWMSVNAMDRVLDWSVEKLKRSALAERHAVPVVDPSTRTVSIFAPGALAKLDIGEWRSDFSLLEGQYFSGVEGRGPRAGGFGLDFESEIDDAAAGLGDGTGMPSDDQVDEWLHGPDSGDVPGGAAEQRKYTGDEKGERQVKAELRRAGS